MPANCRELNEAWVINPPAINPDEAEESAQRLLEEAVALRQWTIPPRARVELPFGPFVAAELTELGDEVYFVWRTEDNRFWRNSVGVENKGFDNIAGFSNDPRVAAAMKLIMAALVRDFLVAEERRKIFDVKKTRVRGSSAKKQEARIVYLPRIRYIIDINAPKRISEGLKQGARARHFVRAFTRKVEKPSPIQLEIAKNERIVVPEGHTFVRAHYRGGGGDQRVYRSRSAMHLLFEAVSRPEIYPEQDDWFEFERMTADLLQNHLGFTVVSRAAKGGDSGIDIRATKQHGDVTEIWIVQCKCYSPNNPVQPDKMRELVGTMAGVKPEAGQVVRGMFVTSSRYTPAALRTAVEHGIQTIDHDDLINICSAVNRANNRSH
jgi:Restriction endonuclease